MRHAGIISLNNGSIRFVAGAGGRRTPVCEPILGGACTKYIFEASLITRPRSILMHGTLRLLAKASSSQSLAFCLLVIVTAFEVFAQSASTGALTGTVTDAQGAVVPKATITLRNNGTGQVLITVTELEGLYRFSLLPPGQYELRVEMAGSAPHILHEVMIQISEVRRNSRQACGPRYQRRSRSRIFAAANRGRCIRKGD